MALLVAWAVLPGLVLAYLRSVRAVRRSRSEFTLCKSEAAELHRATRLFDQIRRRLAQLERPNAGRRLWPVLLKAETDGAADLEERHDLEAYAEHLQATIRQLKRRPLQRLRAWIHMISSHDALAGAIAVYFLGLAFALTASNFFEGGGVALANGAVTAVAAIAALLIYPAQRARLRRQLGLEFQLFKDLAQSDVKPEDLQPEDLQREDLQREDLEREDLQPEGLEAEAPHQAAADDASRATGGGHWCAVLGVPPAADLDDIRQAYKTLIKQNHPDRVHGMSPAFRALAEAETKRINAAYREALAGVSQLEPEYHAA